MRRLRPPGAAAAGPPRALLVPEVLQVSAMDCGPAALQALLAGFDIAVSYPRLRDACQVDLHGSSIDVLEAVALAFGLEAEQLLMPADFVALPAARCLPAVLVTLQPGDVTHFLVVWRRHGRWLQLMDPAAGRRWVTPAALLAETYHHSLRLPAAAWRAWAGTDAFLAPLAARLAALGLAPRPCRRLLAAALADPGWRGLAALDAAVRWTASLLRPAGLRRGSEAASLLLAACAACRADATLPAATALVPPVCWSVRPAPPEPAKCAVGEQASGPRSRGARSAPPPPDEALLFHGAILVRILRRRPALRAARPIPPSTAAPAVSGSTASACHAEPLMASSSARAGVGGTSAGAGCAEPVAATSERPAADPHSSPAPVSPPAPAADTTAGPLRQLVRHALASGIASPAILLAAVGVAVVAAAVEVLLLRSLLDLGSALSLPAQRAAGAALLIAFSAALLLLELPLALGTLRLGRHLELRLRVAFLLRLPRLGDRFLASRLPSDLAERAHAVHRLRHAPELAVRLVRSACGLLVAACGIVWLDRTALPLVLAAAGAALALPLLALPPLGQLGRRLRGHGGVLAGASLDALLGLLPIRAHGAEEVVRRRHEALLARWAAALRRLRHAEAAVDSFVRLVLWALTAALVAGHLRRRGVDGPFLLVAFWAFQLSEEGQSLAAAAEQLPALRAIAARLLEPLATPLEDCADTAEGLPGAAGHAADEAPLRSRGQQDGASRSRSANGSDARSLRARRDPTSAPASAGTPHLRRPHFNRPGVQRLTSRGEISPGPVAPARAADLVFESVTVRVAGHLLLEALDLAISAGEHVAVVGRSGAGKSSLLGILLGWYPPTGGRLLVDGQPLAGPHLRKLRCATAWIDPAVRIWDRTLLDNLLYGSDPGSIGPAEALRRADLLPLLAALPAGLQTSLGDSGARLSDGEGQRLRFARALRRPGVRLALLDEPFRGLDRSQRTTLLGRARERWRAATLLCVTHDLAETRAFPRVLVVERGRVVEDGSPAALAACPRSVYRALLAAEEGIRHALAFDPGWRRLHLAAGRLHEIPSGQ